MIEIGYALRDHHYNIYMLTDGVKDFNQFTQVSVCRKQEISVDLLDDYFYLDSRMGNENIDLSTMGQEVRKRQWKNHYNYVAKVDSQIEFVVKRRVFERLMEGFYPLWTPDVHLAYYQDQPSGFLVLLRVYKVDKALPQIYLEKGRQGSSHMIHLYDSENNNVSVYTNIVNPVMSDSRFQYIKDEIIHLLKTENNFIACYENDEVGRVGLQKRAEIRKALSPRREFEYDPEQIVDRAKSDYDSLFDKILRLDPSLHPFISYVRQITPPQMGEAHALVKKAQNGDTASRTRLVEMFLRVVIKNAYWMHQHHNVSLSDAVQEASIGLIIAIGRYDINSDNKFSTYAPWWMRQNMDRELPIGERIFRLPVHMREKITPIIDITDNHWCEECTDIDICPALISEIMNSAGCDEKTAIWLWRYTFFPQSLEQIVDDYNDRLSDEGLSEQKMIDDIDFTYMVDGIEQALSTLKTKESEVIKMRCGFYSDPMTLEEAGAIFGVTRERIRQIEAKAIKRLRHPSRSKKLKSFY